MRKHKILCYGHFKQEVNRHGQIVPAVGYPANVEAVTVLRKSKPGTVSEAQKPPCLLYYYFRYVENIAKIVY